MPSSNDRTAGRKQGSHRLRWRVKWVAVLGLLLAATSCGERKQPEVASREGGREEVVAKPQLEVGVSGCSGLVQDPERGLVCLIRFAKRHKPLHLWLPAAADSQVDVRFEGVEVATARNVEPDGVMITFELPSHEGKLQVSSADGVWGMELQSVSERFEVLREAVQTSWKSGDADTALERFDSAVEELGDSEAALLACSVQKVVLASGDYDRVLAIAEQVSNSSTISCVGKASLLAAYVHVYLRPDFNAAEQSLRMAERVYGVDLDTRIGAAYLRGGLEHWLGEIDESLINFEQAARLASLVNDDDLYASALVMQAVSLARLGRFSEAEALASEVEQRAGLLYPTVALDIRSSVGWINVLRREDDPTVPDPSVLLRAMIVAYEARGDRRNLANRRLDLALTLVQNEDLDTAAAELAAIEPEVLDPELLVWFELTFARITMLCGEFGSAEHHLERAQLLAELQQDSELEWRVMTASGELERARGRESLAVEKFRQASSLADDLALAVAGGAGRSRFVTTHSRADVALGEMLLKRGHHKEAMCVAMAARARHLRGLWATLRPPLSTDAEERYRDLLSRYQERKQVIADRLEGSWELSTAELQGLRQRLGAEGERADKLLAEATALLEDGAPSWSCARALPRRSGDAVLTMMPSSEGDRWTAMLARRTKNGLSFDIVDIEVIDPNLAASTILAHFGRALEQTGRLQVIPVGVFVGVDFYARWLEQGKDELWITYSLGLGAAEGLSGVEPRAVVLAGATNLATVHNEAAAITERLRRIGWTVDSRWSPTAESQPSLLHYAGHGIDGGLLGWQSAIEVPHVGPVSAAQIVAGQRAPSVVVLGACGAARVTTESIDGGMNLAAAFLLAGARLVIAPIRDVDDTAAFELGVGLYQSFDSEELETLVRVLARLQREQAEQTVTPSDAKSYLSWRAWTP